MFKKVAWIVILLVMTACTIIFSDKLDFSRKDATPVALEPFEPTESMEMLSTAFNTATSAASETDIATSTDASDDGAMDKTIEPVGVTNDDYPKYVVQEGNPTYLANFNYPDAGCEWQGVAGQVFNRKLEPRKYLVVKVFGRWNGEEISQMAITGMVEGKPYGKGSYEIVLGDVAIDSTEPLYIQLFKSDGTVLSEPIQFFTKAKCNRNLVLINFVKN